ncbi:hypothetical protein KDX20_21960 [Burkholderia cenocepacia]|uniref:hypothetical protein n=1 Tax=Burkholderia cenocepacia TaxID=95486 RepID=UPI001B9FB842|nr:hypothetical protein [Burkholderia cenocepacia]MBR8157102.1 hypothetical protein [Burkholderia cenocepacia]
MDRYKLENAREKVRGYYFPKPHEEALGKHEGAFDRAKAECLHHLREQIADIDQLTFEQFRTKRAA